MSDSIKDNGHHKRKHGNDHDKNMADNKKATTERLRQWQVVYSTSEEEEDNHSISNDNYDNNKLNNQHIGSNHTYINTNDDRSSGGSSDNDSTSSDQSSDGKKHHKHDKKHSKKEKKDKKHSKKEKKHKKDKKHKKHKHDKEQSRTQHNINQNEYGKYGIIKEEHIFHKQREFEAYMEEVKHIPGIMYENKRDIMQHFKSFIEDYNTATMPHDKYYNYEKWEIQEYERNKLLQQQKQKEQYDNDINTYNPKLDEEIRKKELKQLKHIQEQNEFLSLKAKMSSNKDQQEHMKKQAQLTTELHIAYKRGDTATVKRLERLLQPDENKTAVKHPWA